VRYKVVPPVRSVSFLREASECLPLVPGTVEDCCTRIRDGTDLQSRDMAREYLTFLQALGLAEEAEQGFYRPREAPGGDELRDAYRARVFGADAVIDAVASGVETPDAVFEGAVEPTVPRWERDRDQHWRATWRERTERLLEWGVTFGTLERAGDDRYRPTM
jgi:hypothetical protein